MTVRVPEPVALLVLLGLLMAAIVGCRGPKTQTEPRGIGFRFEGDPHVVGGAIVAQPSGREESFLHFVVAGAPGWVSHCMQEQGDDRSPLVFTFGTNERGRVRPGPLPADVSARARCVANAAVAEGTGPLTAQTEVTVQLMLKPLP